MYTNLGGYASIVSIAKHSEDPGLQIWPVEEAIAHAKPLPPRADLALGDVTDKEWDSFYSALSEA
jgi:hypothetical protein